MSHSFLFRDVELISCICFLRHIETKGEEHIEIHEMYMIGFQADADNGLFAAFTNVWMLLNYFRVINSEWPLQIMGDGTFRFCHQDMCLLGMGVMTPGGKLQPLVYSYVPTESSEAYESVWKSFERTLISFSSKFRRCQLESCSKCDCIHEVLTHEIATKCCKPSKQRNVWLRISRARTTVLPTRNFQKKKWVSPLCSASVTSQECSFAPLCLFH